MIQAILSYQFILKPGEGGILEPEFKPISLIFNNKDFTQDNYSELIVKTDIFGIFYQLTTGISTDIRDFSNFYIGRLKQTPYQVTSYFKQDVAENQFITIAIFELDDDIEIFEDIIKKMAENLDDLFLELIKMRSLKQLSRINNVMFRIESEFKFTIFQVERLSDLDKLQKVALIYQKEERLKILEVLREKPISKKELKNILERIKPNPNIDTLIQPFLGLNLIRRDWIKGETGKRTLDLKSQGEYLFLTKDIALARFPSKELMDRIKENKNELYEEYEQKITGYFSTYDINKQPIEELRELSTALLNPDCFDFYTLMTKNYYPLDKIPKIFSDFVDFNYVIDTMENLNIITKIYDKTNKPWVILLTEIKPLIIFPEYLLNKIKGSYLSKDVKNKISREIAKKAFNLLEVTYQEKVEF